MVAIIIPAIIISLILGLVNGFEDFDYPILYLKNTMTTFKTIPNYLDSVKEEIGFYPTIKWDSSFLHYAPAGKINANH